MIPVIALVAALASILGFVVLMLQTRVLRERRLFFLLLASISVITLRYGPYVFALEWRVPFRRPMEIVCGILPICVLVWTGRTILKGWMAEKESNREILLAAIMCCVLVTGLQVKGLLYTWSDYIVVEDEKPAYVQEGLDSGSFAGREYYPYHNEVFRSIKLISLEELDRQLRVPG